MLKTLNHLPFFLLLAVLSCFLWACTTDLLPDEEFEAPTSTFPLLGHVPDRPSFPDPEAISHKKKHLQQEHDQATEKRKDVVNSITP